ncbi:biotin/lipoyl-containing protein [Salmonirosea aquatica]|uniref:Biotin/lipoyl-binding protein n=1 Tax=Salmonirosea aquatica TaxID=2654236 RepID=A0A7C9BDR8_9BACT|nr:biotin/lipoyl-binding protein [Cytophagaceae bacterium SJW1-29]
MLKITVNEASTFEVRQEKDKWYLDGSLFEGDVAQLSPNRYHVLWKDRSFEVEVVEYDPAEKKTTLKINGQLLTTTTKDRVALLLESMGMDHAIATKINEVKAPMPGLIQTVSVKVGDAVKKGDILLVLVAMKMENTIKAPAEATVKAIRIEPGTSVEKNQVLIEFA